MTTLRDIFKARYLAYGTAKCVCGHYGPEHCHDPVPARGKDHICVWCDCKEFKKAE